MLFITDLFFFFSLLFPVHACHRLHDRHSLFWWPLLIRFPVFPVNVIQGWMCLSGPSFICIPQVWVLSLLIVAHFWAVSSGTNIYQTNPFLIKLVTARAPQPALLWSDPITFCPWLPGDTTAERKLLTNLLEKNDSCQGPDGLPGPPSLPGKYIFKCDCLTLLLN